MRWVGLLAFLALGCGDSSTDDPMVSEEIGSATEALSESGAALSELTESVANAAATTAMTTGMRDDNPEGRRDVAMEVAMMATEEQGTASCVTSETALSPLQVTLTYDACPLTSGNMVSGILRLGIDSWNPLTFSVAMEDLQLGGNRFWASMSLALPTGGGDGGMTGPAEPTLSGSFTVLRPSDLLAVSGDVRFLEDRTIFSGELGYKEGSDLDAMMRLIYRVGETGIESTVNNVTIETGQCAPTAGTGQFIQSEITGITTGASETTNIEELVLEEQLNALVTFLPSTPSDGIVNVQLGTVSVPLMLLQPCAPSP